MATEPLIVQAIYAFKGTNNDELCFKKGDKITVTQREDGGWWEGTLGEKTGWFPSNYVKEFIDGASPAASPIRPSVDFSQQRQYRAVVLKDLIDSEKAHIAELHGLVSNFLQPLEKSDILNRDEYRQLTGNLMEVLDTHVKLLSLIEECVSRPSNEQRVGKLFLHWAPHIKTVHQTYCALHPKAVCILDKYKNELTAFMEKAGAASPGLLVLTTGLSKPFRRLDKYPGMLQELERHVEESHPDRGDTQRSVAVYKELASTCAATRRQKELELQVLTGPVRGWEGQSLSQLGDILHMGSVAVGPQHHDRYLVLFPTTLLVLSVSQRMSAFIYEGKLPLTGITVSKLEDTETYKNAFDIAGPLIERIVAVCQSRDEAQAWVDLLLKHTQTRVMSKVGPPNEACNDSPHPPPHMRALETNNSGRLSSNANGVLKRAHTFSHSNTLPPSSNKISKSIWTVSCLRPAAPVLTCLASAQQSLSATSSPKKQATTSYEEDALILKVVEAYCTSPKSRNTVSSVDLGYLTRGNVHLRDQHNTKIHATQLHRSHPHLPQTAKESHSAASGSSSSSSSLPSKHWNVHGPRASTWCCGSFVLKQLRKTQHLD